MLLISGQTFLSFRTIVDVNIDAFDEKPWKLPGADITDFFNFDFDEDSWKNYCNHLVKKCLFMIVKFFYIRVASPWLSIFFKNIQQNIRLLGFHSFLVMQCGKFLIQASVGIEDQFLKLIYATGSVSSWRYQPSKGNL